MLSVLISILGTFAKRNEMKFLSLQPFIPSGSNFEASKQLFQGLGFDIRRDPEDYVRFENNGLYSRDRKYSGIIFK